MIEHDDELINIFRTESAEHIQRLEEGFLRLEKEPGNQAVLQDTFREAHSLKGAARMVGLTGVEALSHRIEDILGSAKSGAAGLSSGVIDGLCKGLDAIRNIIRQALDGESSDVTVSDVLERMKIAPESGAAPSAEQARGDQGPEMQEGGPRPSSPGIEGAEAPARRTHPPVVQPEGSAPVPDQPHIRDFRIDTIRVDTHKLDKLMSQTGELNVTSHRIAQRLEDITDAMALWEGIARKLPASGPGDKPVITVFGAVLNAFRGKLYEDSSRLALVAAELQDNSSQLRLLPLSIIFNLFQRMVRDLAKESSKEVALVIEGGDTPADKRIIEEMKDPLIHMVRNAVDHGIETPEERLRKNKPRSGTVTLRASQTPSNVIIEVSDDGRGLDADAIRRAALKGNIANEGELASMSQSQVQSLIFVSGLSTSDFVSDVSGRGVGLDVVRANAERLKGTVHFESSPDRGCSIRVQLPLTLVTSRVMIVAVSGIKYAVSVEHVQTTCLMNLKDAFTIKGRRTIVFDKAPVPVAGLADLLGLKERDTPIKRRDQRPEKLPCVIVSAGDNSLGLLVDELLDEQEVVLKQYSAIVKRARNISGSTILGTGEVCLVLNPFDLIKTFKKIAGPSLGEKPAGEAESRQRILVAEDSMTVRTQMKRILEGAGYDVTVAVDGLDAYGKLAEGPYDALISDIMMPKMDGLALTGKLRQDKRYREMPVILVTSLASDLDRRRGMEAGANAYITKPSFDQKALLETLRRLA